MVTSTDVAMVRHVVQRILVPCVVVIGLLGNSVSIYVLTRKRMRCTTNIYLTALAITDIAYLMMQLLASFQHYQYIQLNCELYYACYGIIIWLVDACAYISIYIAVCFTIERFIAIRYVLKRQTFCTESLAKKVLAGVALFCLLTTISTAFEHEYRIDTKLIDSQGKPCNLTLLARNSTTNHPALKTVSTNLEHHNEQNDNNDDSVHDDDITAYRWSRNSSTVDELRDLGKTTIAIATTTAPEEDELRRLMVKRNATTIDAISVESKQEYQPKKQQEHIPDIVSALYPRGKLEFLLNAKFPDNRIEVSTIPDWMDKIHTLDTCTNVSYYKNVVSELGNNNLYKKVYYYFTLFIFVLVPLCVLGTFNCILITLVRQSKNVRGDLTNASSMRKSTKRKSHLTSVSQENRVTVTLIAVVLLFIICQLPWAIYLIVSEQMDIDFNLQAIFGNIFNFLAAINAAANFFLYCVLSDKYRKTVRELITGYKYRKQRFNNNNYNNASLYTAASNGSRRSRQVKMAPTAQMSTSSSVIYTK